MKADAKIGAGLALLGLGVGAWAGAKYKDGKLAADVGGEAGKGAGE